MKILARHGERDYRSESIASARRLESPFSGEQFACLLWNHGDARDVDRASALLESLLDGGCRYLVCGGDDCEWWHDMADELFVAKYLDSSEAEREENQVMTTWHADEPPEDVAFFFVFNTSFDDITFSRFLVLNLGSEAKLSVVDARVQEQARTLAR